MTSVLTNPATLPPSSWDFIVYCLSLTTIQITTHFFYCLLNVFVAKRMIKYLQAKQTCQTHAMSG
jgi:hypothetical protein